MHFPWLRKADKTPLPSLSQYYCPCCEQEVEEWLPLRRNVGIDERRLEPTKRLCPHCKSFERTRHFWLYLQQERLLENKPRFLHIAPEGSIKRKLRALLREEYVTTDLTMPNMDFVEDITQMSFEDESFDFIYCSNVLEHVQEDLAAMREIYRVLRRGGMAIIQVPIKGKETFEDPSIVDPAERGKHFGQADHVRYYGEDIAGRLASAGFEVTPFYMLDVLKVSEDEITRMNLNKRELIHKCTK